MKILFVAPKLPHPPKSGSALIAYNYLRHLSSKHEIDLIACDTQPDDDFGELKVWCRNITAIPTLSRRQIRLNAGLGLLAGWPLPVSHYFSPTNSQRIKSAIERGGYDMAIFQLLEMGQFLHKNCKTPSILSMEDPLSLKNERWLPFVRSLKLRLRTYLEVGRLRHYEKRLIPRFRRTVLINQADALACQQWLPHAQLAWAPYGIDTKHFQPRSDIERESNAIVISGTMSHPPNVDGILYFCQHVFPQVIQRVQDTKLYLVGANPVSAIKSLASERIIVVGAVADIRLNIQRSIVSVCPVRLKIGTQTKILEAMALGTPVVTTSAGNNGIEGISGKHLLVADEPSEMAEHIVSLLNRHQWHHLANEGRRYVEENFDWAISTGKFEDILQSAR